MLKMILGVIVGFVVWSILWVGGDEVIRILSSGYAANQDKMALAIVNGEAFTADTTILIIGLLRSFITSIVAGFIAAVIANENNKTPMILGALLLIVGVLVEASVWNYLPLWYHTIFLLLLVPMTIFGAKLKRST